MDLPERGVLLRVFVGESKRSDGRPLYERIVHEARAHDLAGATVVRGVMGYGASSRIHTARVLALSEELPVVVEIVDSDEKIQAFLPVLDGIVTEGLVTLEDVRVLHYRHRS